jgi:hypothetical protein
VYTNNICSKFRFEFPLIVILTNGCMGNIVCDGLHTIYRSDSSHSRFIHIQNILLLKFPYDPFTKFPQPPRLFFIFRIHSGRPKASKRDEILPLPLLWARTTLMITVITSADKSGFQLRADDLGRCACVKLGEGTVGDRMAEEFLESKVGS